MFLNEQSWKTYHQIDAAKTSAKGVFTNQWRSLNSFQSFTYITYPFLFISLLGTASNKMHLHPPKYYDKK